MKLKYILYIMLALPLLWSCNNEDDLEEIFASGTWYVVNYFGKANWDRGDGEPMYKPIDSEGNIDKEGRKALETIHAFSLTFKADGTFSGSMERGDFSGTWQADGKERTIRLRVSSNPNTSGYSLSRTYIETLENAAFYRGDSNYIMLAPEDKKTYIQFTHKPATE